MTDTSTAVTVPSLEDQRAFVSWQLSQGWKRDDIVSALIKQGVDAPSAERLLDEMQPPKTSSTHLAYTATPPAVQQRPTTSTSSSTRSPFVVNRRIIIGVLAFAAGLILTVVGYQMAPATGGRYFVFWGLMVYGIIEFIRGCMNP